MSKNPAILWYPNDYLGETMGMTFEGKGAFVELLMMQFIRGHMGGHMIAQTVGQLWGKIKDKFIQDDNGLWCNECLEEEMGKRENFVNSRRNNLSGNNQHPKSKKKADHMAPHMGGHVTTHMENENRDRNRNKKGGAGGKNKPKN